MSCKKGKPNAEPKPGRFLCDDCGAVATSKKKICEPKKIKKSKKSEKADAGEST